MILEKNFRCEMILKNSNPFIVNNMLNQYFEIFSNKEKIAKIVKKYEFKNLEEASLNLDLIMEYSDWRKFNFSVDDFDYSKVVDDVYLNLNAERKIEFQKGRGLRFRARRKTKGYCTHYSFLLASIGKHFGKEVHILSGSSEYLDVLIGKQIKKGEGMHSFVYCKTEDTFLESSLSNFIIAKGDNPFNIKKEKVALNSESINYLKNKKII